LLVAQSLGGEWTGQLWQTGATDTFTYTLYLQQAGNAISGQARSTTAGGGPMGAFVLSGRWEDGQLTLQEVEQLQPKDAKWCLKFLQLTAVSEKNNAFTGSWTATGCKPGNLRIFRQGAAVETEIPFEFPGRWTGQLTQTDREYGFYYELKLNADGTGTSHIVSEGAGGEATHALNWQRTDDQITFRESEVIKRTDPKWKWCLKAGQLTLNRQGQQYEMNGNWSGYMEHKTPQTGACAPGELFLQKPVLTRTVTQQIAPQQQQYTQQTQRAVKVDRVLQVQSDQVRLKVWDNGIVDGDILTLFLNGEQILDHYRVNKRKWSFPVNILRGENLLILHAEDLGDISPNTVAVAIDDGVSEQIVIMSSNLEESGAILIQPFVHGEE
ncbi:MAG: hypothetical protein AAGJ82_09675, partial [Bacteroidota bacterium]